jgi:hypothetical protein
VSFGLSGFISPKPATSTHFIVRKTRFMVDNIADEIERLDARNIVEIGIDRGGSTALLAQLAQPNKLVAIEYDRGPVEALSDYIRERGLADRVKLYFGLDQGDRAHVDTMLEAEFGNEPLDLVIDDASHLYRQTRSSFNALFPRIKLGGVFILEDWNWAHLVGAKGFTTAEGVRDSWPTGTPLSQLVLEFVLTQGTEHGVISSVTIDDASVRVERGPADLDPRTFDISTSFVEGPVNLLAIRQGDVSES